MKGGARALERATELRKLQTKAKTAQDAWGSTKRDKRGVLTEERDRGKSSILASSFNSTTTTLTSPILLI